jgi:hypothetical protein
MGLLKEYGEILLNFKHLERAPKLIVIFFGLAIISVLVATTFVKFSSTSMTGKAKKSTDSISIKNIAIQNGIGNTQTNNFSK